MSKKKDNLKNKVGKPPGTLIYSGEKISKSVKINLLKYGDDIYEFSEAKSYEEVEKFLKDASPEHKIWINIIGLTDVVSVSKIGKLLNLHSLVMEDILNAYQRPKIDIYDEFVFSTLKRINFNADGCSELDNYSLVIKDNIVVSFQDAHDDYFGEIYTRIKNGGVLIKKLGVDYLYYVLIDFIVDNYFVAGEELYERLETLQEQLMFSAEKGDLEQIQTLKKEIATLRHAIRPTRDILNTLISSDLSRVSHEVGVYLRDTLDHQTQIMETIESYRDSITGLMDLYLSALSNRMNEVMKVLTIIATIFIPLTFIAGVYGMNFKVMPELEWEYGYPVVMGFMLIVGLALGYYFKKKHWL